MKVGVKLEELLKPRSVTGLHVVLDQQQIWYCKLIRKGKVVSVEGGFKHVNRLEDLKVIGDNLSPVSLVIQGKGILHKQIQCNSGSIDFASTLQLVKQAWPSIQIDDFYVQRYNSKGIVFLSLIRRNILDKVLEELQGIKLTVLDISIGGFAIAHIFPFIADAPESIYVGTELYQIKDTEIVGVANTPEINQELNIIQIGSEAIPINWLPSYSAALNSLALQQVNSVFYSDYLDVERQEWKQARLFKIAGWSFLITLLTSLLFNFFLFTSFQQKHQELATQAEEVSDLVGRLNKLEATQKAQRSFLSEAGWLQPVKSSFYLDRLAASMPARIQLTELSLYPVNQKRTKAENQLIVEPGTILVKGRCAEAQVLNGWLQKLVKLPWVDKVADQHYSYDYNEQTGNFQFQVILSNH